jgi:S1-C subfamily serine protease
MKTPALLLLGLALGLPAYAADPAPATPNYARFLGNSIADAVEKVLPSVVVVRTEAVRYRMARDWFYGQMYGIPEKLAGQGSGVIISKDGYILTNNHVVDEAEEIEVVLDDGTKHPAKVIGTDPHTDLAVLKIQAGRGETFNPVEPGDSDKLRMGEFVIAIGSPFSLASSVTMGIVSQKGRSIGALPYEDFIQSDAAVNQGNSGGPLVDVDGRMVGINTMIQTAGYSGGSIGISFAIPINLAMRVADSIIRTGKWERPWIGVSMNTTRRGVLVEEVVDGSPAAAAGIAVGDRLITVEGAPVASPRDVQRQIMKQDAGGTVSVTVERSGKERTLKIKTERMPPPVMMYRR